jgi:hypothetical protein
MVEGNTYEINFGRTTFVVTPKFTGTATLEDILKQSIKRKIESESIEARFNGLHED